jgi:hypothetical protein
VHPGIIGDDYNKTAANIDEGGIDERISGYVQAHMLHRDQRAPAGERDSQRFFVSGLFVAAPGGVGPCVFLAWSSRNSRISVEGVPGYAYAAVKPA